MRSFRFLKLQTSICCTLYFVLVSAYIPVNREASLHWLQDSNSWNMEAFKPGLKTCSLTKELLRCDGASTSEQTKNKNSIKMERASYHNLKSAPRNKGAEMATKSSLVLGCSSSKANHSCKGKAVLCSSGEIEELNERMRILEEETESMKQEIYVGAEERRMLIDEIYQQFQILTRKCKLNDGSTSTETPTQLRLRTDQVRVDEQDEIIGAGLSEDIQEDLVRTLSLLL